MNEILEQLEKNKVVLLKNQFPETPNWDNFFNFIEAIKFENYNKTIVRQEPISIQDDILYIRVSDCVDPIKQSSTNQTIPQLDQLINYFNILFNEKCKYSEAYINLSKSSRTLPPHNDQWAAIVWGCIGSMEWRIFPPFDDDSYISYIVNPGDILIVPRLVRHTVIPMGPRASITLAYNSMIDME